MLWFSGGALLLALAMIVALLALVLWQGGASFWPGSIERFARLAGPDSMGEVMALERFAPDDFWLEAHDAQVRERAASEQAASDGLLVRRLVRSENFDLTGRHYEWVADCELRGRSQPPWALLLERLGAGRLYAVPQALLLDGEPVSTGPDATWQAFQSRHAAALSRRLQRVAIEDHEVGRVNARIERARQRLREVALEHGQASAAWREQSERHDVVVAQASADYQRLLERIEALRSENDRTELRLTAADGQSVDVRLSDIVRAYPANRLDLSGRMGVYLSRWWEYLSEDPRESNSAGGVWPAIFGTISMTLVMCLLVVPFGVLAALYLREYARQGLLVSVVRVAVNNLAGVPSIVFGVFGLGFFCTIVGGWIDQEFYAANLPNPTFGKDGLLWASFTLALLTLPVVIVATEEALASVPDSMREGSLACGATRWQTIRRIVLPRAAPGIMTGMVLAIARGAGEVAPLMLVGAVKLADELPLDMSDWSGSLGPLPTGPLHLQRSFMHLGFHIYDLGFQSPDSEAAKPMVYTTTMLLIAIVVALNLLAVAVRAKLRRKFGGATV